MKIVVIGCGTIGKTVIKHVSKEGHSIIAIDDDKKVIEELIEKYLRNSWQWRKFRHTRRSSYKRC